MKAEKKKDANFKGLFYFTLVMKIGKHYVEMEKQVSEIQIFCFLLEFLREK